MDRSEYSANLYLQHSHRARQISTTRMPQYAPVVRLRFLVALILVLSMAALPW